MRHSTIHETLTVGTMRFTQVEKPTTVSYSGQSTGLELFVPERWLETLPADMFEQRN